MKTKFQTMENDPMLKTVLRKIKDELEILQNDIEIMSDSHLRKQIDEAVEDVREGRLISWNELQRFWKEHH